MGQKQAADRHRLSREALAATRRAARWLERAAGYVECVAALVEDTDATEVDRLWPIVARLMEQARTAKGIRRDLERGGGPA